MYGASVQGISMKELISCSRVSCLAKRVIFTLIMIFFYGLSCASIFAQDLPSQTQVLDVQPPLSFSTEFQDDQSTLALFNLLHFTGTEREWEGAKVEIKLPVKDKDILLSKRLSQLTLSSGNGGHSQLPGVLPALDYEHVGTLASTSELTKPIWVIWIPSVSSRLSKTEKEALEEILKTVRDQSGPEGLLYLYEGRLSPRLIYSASRIADINLKEIELLKSVDKKRTRPRRNTLSTLKISAVGLGEVLKATQLHYNSLSEQHFHNTNYSCGRACREMIPTLRMIILNEGELALPTTPPESQKVVLESTKYPQHLLYKPHLYIVELPTKSKSVANQIPKWLTGFSQLSAPDHSMIGDLEQLSDEIDRLEHHAKSTYYSVPPIAITQYFWGQEQIKVSSRITHNEKSLVQGATLAIPFDTQQGLNGQRLRAYQTYQKRLEDARQRFVQPQKLSFVTRVFIGILWVGLCFAALSVIVIRLRKNRSLTSQPIVRQALNVPTVDRSRGSPSTPPQEREPSSVDRTPPPDHQASSHELDPGDYARNKRQERERSLKVNKPSQASPMIDPDDPSTVPAPAAEAKVSDQPGERLIKGNSNEPKNLNNNLEAPIEQLDMIADVLSLDSIPPNQREGSQDDNQGDQIRGGQENIDDISVGSPKEVEDFSEVITLNTLPIAGLYAERGPMRRFFFLIYQSPAMVGRNPTNHCALPPDGSRSDRQVSRDHFELSLIEDQRWEVRCTSAQGMKLNSNELTRGESALIRDRDIVIIGETYLRFRCSTAWRTHQVKEHLKLIAPKAVHDT
jgi:hypothetical protein